MKAKYFNPYTDFGFKKLFGEEANKSLMKYRDLKAVLDTSFEEGYEKGEQAGLEKGKIERDRQIAKTMKNEGESIEKIATYTGLSKEEIEKL